MKKIFLILTVIMLSVCGVYDSAFAQQRVAPRQKQTSTINQKFRAKNDPASEIRLQSNGTVYLCVNGEVMTDTSYKITGSGLERDLVILNYQDEPILYGTIYYNSGGYPTGLYLYGNYWEPF